MLKKIRIVKMKTQKTKPKKVTNQKSTLNESTINKNIVIEDTRIKINFNAIFMLYFLFIFLKFYSV